MKWIKIGAFYIDLASCSKIKVDKSDKVIEFINIAGESILVIEAATDSGLKRVVDQLENSIGYSSLDFEGVIRQGGDL